MPERSFGSNQVAFGGIILPLSAISIICFIDTGYSARAIFISPLSTRRFSSLSPRSPPTKSILLSERRYGEQSDGIPDCQDRRKAGGRIHARRIEERYH